MPRDLHPTKERGRLSLAEYDEAEATAIAGDILDRSYQYGDDLEPLARFYLALVAERDALREAAQALITARAEGASIEPWGALIAALERHL